jgi:hypothetical protein
VEAAAAEGLTCELTLPDFRRTLCRMAKTGNFYYHCDWHASHYVKVLLDQILQLSPVVNQFAELEGIGAHGKCAEIGYEFSKAARDY